MPSPLHLLTIMAETLKHYMVRGCNRKIVIDDMFFPFEPYIREAGQWLGLYSTKVKEEQEILEKTSWIYPLNEEEYQSELKKKAGISTEYNPLPGNQQPHTGTPTGDAGAAQRETKSSMAEEAEEPEDLDLADIIKPSPVRKPKSAKKAK